MVVVISLSLVDPHTLWTTPSTFLVMIRTGRPYFWSPNWRTHVTANLVFHGSDITFTWLTGTIKYCTGWNKHWNCWGSLSYQKDPSYSSGLEPMRQVWQKRVCILNTVSYPQCEFNLTFCLSPEAAGKPVTPLEYFHSEPKHPTFLTLATDKPVTTHQFKKLIKHSRTSLTWTLWGALWKLPRGCVFWIH